MFRPSLALLVLVAMASPLVAQRPNLNHYTARQGLSQAQVLAVAQDRAGYLWFGTYAGVSRYDGGRFHHLSTRDGLPYNTVRQLLALSDARLAVRTVGHHLCFITSFPGAEFDIDCRAVGEDDLLLQDMEAAGDVIWLGSDRGLWRHRKGQLEELTSAPGLPSPNCQALSISGGWLWVGTDRGLARRPLEDDSAEFEVVAPFAGSDVRVLAAPRDQGLVVATAQGLAHWTEDGIEWAQLSPHQVVETVDLALDADGMIWLASANGVVGWHGRSLLHLDDRRGLPGNLVHAVFVDRENTLWMGTDFGVTKLVPGPFSTFGTEDGVPGPLVRAVAEDAEGQLWIGTRAGVARKADGRFETVQIPQMTDPRVYSLAAADAGGMWIGSRAGLALWRDGARRFLTERHGLPHPAVMSLAVEPGHGLFIGTSRGVTYLREGEEMVQVLDAAGLERSSVASMLRRGEGELWLGLAVGGVRILHYTPAESGVEIRDVRVLGAEQGWTDRVIWSMASDSQGNVWLGTNGDGALRIDPEGGSERLDTASGLANDFVWQVLPDGDGDLWLFTSRGLNRFRPATGEMEHFGFSDGLPGLEGVVGAALRDRQGHLWFGTSAGIVRFDREQQVTNRVPPVVVIDELRSQRYGRLQPGASVARDAGVLTASFSALSFRDEQAVRFRYRLEGGAPASWSEPFAQRTLSFANLGPGQYRLLVEAANGAGTWSEEPASLDFEVRRAWWQTWPFLGFGLVLVTALASAGLRWRTRHLEAERRRLEALVSERALELESKNRRLEQQLEKNAEFEAERQRLEERLRQSEKMQAVGRLAGGVAHDFNNLLTTISGFGELLRDQVSEKSPLQAEVNEILDAAERAARLTQQLLAFSRKQVVEPHLLPLNEVVEDISRMLRRLIGEDVALSLGLNARADTVRCDRGQLEQVLVNLAVNARDSMTGGGTLTLRTRNDLFLNPTFGHLGQEIAEGNYVAVEVEDTGSGIDPEILHHIFEPFFTTKDAGQGTGLGLATVYGIVRQNEGSIDVDSEVGRGTRFIVRLPVVSEQPATRNTSGALPVGKITVQTHTILVVEDEETVRRLVIGILEKYGYRVLEAAGGKEAFEVSDRFDGRIDLLLTDVVMPETGGHVVAERLERQRPDLRVLFISGYPDDYLGQRGILPTGTNFLNKPFTPKKLIRKVREVLEEGPDEGMVEQVPPR